MTTQNQQKQTLSKYLKKLNFGSEQYFVKNILLLIR